MSQNGGRKGKEIMPSMRFSDFSTYATMIWFDSPAGRLYEEARLEVARAGKWTASDQEKLRERMAPLAASLAAFEARLSKPAANMNLGTLLEAYAKAVGGTVDSVRELSAWESLEPPYEAPGFSPMLQGPGSNMLAQIDTRSAVMAVDEDTGAAAITRGEFTAFIEGYEKHARELVVSTHKLLRICQIALTASVHYRGSGEPRTSVSIPLGEYLQLCGKPQTKSEKDKARRRVKKDLDTLFGISIEWSERRGKGEAENYEKMRIVTRQGIKNGIIGVEFSSAFAKYLRAAYLAQYPQSLLGLDERNPSLFYVGEKLALHYSMDSNHTKGTANIISIRAVLDACPSIPSYEAVKKTDRHYDRRIIRPLENTLDSLREEKVIKGWEYCNSKGAPLTKKQLDSLAYSDCMNLYIKFGIKGFPSQAPRLTDRADAAKNAKQQRKKNSAKRSTSTPTKGNGKA
jgi:hypothetical protein